MYKRGLAKLLLAAALLVSLPACWSSREIEDLSLYTGMALDQGKPSLVEKELEERGGSYKKRNTLTATLQIVPEKIIGNTKTKDKQQQQQRFFNISETGDSLLEIFRQFSIRRDRPIIGHHLKVIVVSEQLAAQENMRQLMDFVLRDNDIRPSCMVFLSEGNAAKTLTTTHPDEIPSFRLRDMIGNRFRTNKLMEGVNLSKLDALMHSKQSFILQNIVESESEVEFSGAGIIKGETGQFIGNLDQGDVESINWIKGEIKSGTIKAYDEADEVITYEIKSAESKITVKESADDELSFHVKIESTGRLIEKWNNQHRKLDEAYLKEFEKHFKQRLTEMINRTMLKMKTTYKVDVAGFGQRLSIEEPQKWKKVKDHWDEMFSTIPVTFEVKLTITDYGSFTE
ncbi:Ger(x)C family spore germination protein [Paenibacillus donghaensis]|uniref:Spore gernimation protein GerC n=1 Tax=Paenibacillus donghaensis TaxID=414771 RepID=A0A2Z2KBN9_9BACL|nr:Ger(x)C family spore germination protein [Paenibacillus donghaensis]ASA20400.1 spore gernimation protein GerC [Paenibacillus donghaensis]